MPATDQRSRAAEDDERLDRAADFDLTGFPGVDPGEMDTWEIARVHCPECDRSIALVGDEERLPQHAVLPTAWHPFSPALCPGSGAPTDDLAECDDFLTDFAAPGAEALLALPAELDWRTQPFSHVGGPGAVPVTRANVPAQRARGGLVRR
ncbi:hypothetical protein [Kitasatospora sp. GP82]|uniref:hypothetical protein n=1 Tax=Kitasatospora sp. GP82 TaxID=3035089 RepID=UPI0024760B63|nr:hypothetical protein [Kitasatospora sp. GP82]MDH6124762.1 hypothetical protein [Kitasatospora sp. GP82]